MGETYVVGRVIGPTGQAVEVRFLVDSGAAYSLLPYEVWCELGLTPRRTDVFRIADGTRIARAVSGCRIALPQGEAGDSPVILGEPGDVPLLGLVTLEELGLVVNPRDRTLERADQYLLRIA